MSRLSLEDFDKHIEALRTQLQFFNETLEATDHNAPDWLATDLISLRNRSGRLHDDMKRFRDQLDIQGLAEKKAKTSHKRLSIEGSKASITTARSHPPSSKSPAGSTPLEHSPIPRSKPAPVEETYVVQHIDVTEEVNRRLRESRLRRLMETPSTAQKRKYNAYEEPGSGRVAGTEDDEQRGGYSGSEYERTLTKRLKSSGTFEQVRKRKENGLGRPDEEAYLDEQAEFKRRKL